MTVSADAGYATRRVDVAAAGDAELRALAEFRRAWDAERMPEDPPVPLELAMKRLWNRPPTMEPLDWIARDAGEIVGWASLIRWTNLTNPDRREVWIVAELRAISGAAPSGPRPPGGPRPGGARG